MRSYDNDWLIDDQPMLSPDQGVEISENDLDSEDSGRDESGIMHRFPVRERVHTWAFSYAVLTAEEYQYIKSLFAGKPTFTFSYRDDDGEMKQCTAYCSKTSITLHNSKTGIYKNLKVNIIEC